MSTHRGGGEFPAGDVAVAASVAVGLGSGVQPQCSLLITACAPSSPDAIPSPSSTQAFSEAGQPREFGATHLSRNSTSHGCLGPALFPEVDGASSSSEFITGSCLGFCWLLLGPEDVDARLMWQPLVADCPRAWPA